MPRPKGSKNKSTILREAEVDRVLKNAQGLLLREVQAVIEALVKKAKDGDVSAAKLILERAIPARRAEDLSIPKQNFAIQVNITPTEIGHGQERQIGSEQESRTAVEFDGNAAGESGSGPASFTVVALNGGAEG